MDANMVDRTYTEYFCMVQDRECGNTCCYSCNERSACKCSCINKPSNCMTSIAQTKTKKVNKSTSNNKVNDWWTNYKR